jgi:hypothetical protein
MPDRQGFTFSAEQHLLMRHETAQPNAMDPNPRRSAPRELRATPARLHLGEAPRAAALRAEAILCAVFAAVPDGASTLPG